MLSYVKLTAAGNDFVLLDGRDGLPEAAEDLARRFCARRLSIGADGLIVVEATDGLPPLGVTHYEPDGTRTFCLNGVRGAASWLVATGQHPAGEAMVLRTDFGDLDVIPSERDVEIVLPPPRSLERRSVLTDDLTVLGCFLDVGNPQFVVVLDSMADLESPTLMDRAHEIRWREDLFPGGTNVCFVAQDGDCWQIRSYERGVEAETLACGSGAVAAACALVEAPYPEAVLASASHERPGGGSGKTTNGSLTIVLKTRAGHVQHVTFPDGPGSHRIRARGPVRMVAGGQVWS
jgi:diaminopimelate epimerase